MSKVNFRHVIPRHGFHQRDSDDGMRKIFFSILDLGLSIYILYTLIYIFISCTKSMVVIVRVQETNKQTTKQIHRQLNKYKLNYS